MTIALSSVMDVFLYLKFLVYQLFILRSHYLHRIIFFDKIINSLVKDLKRSSVQKIQKIRLRALKYLFVTKERTSVCDLYIAHNTNSTQLASLSPSVSCFRHRRFRHHPFVSR